ncbi:MAG: hypothetical protein M3R01_00975 [Actinomycetota bacterium]|nr:hypothetical protein [Actinomycetota bacterium]
MHAPAGRAGALTDACCAFSAQNRRVRVIALNGTSTAGKSTLAAAMQHQFAAQGQCWVILGIDDFLGKLPAPWVRYHEAGAHAELAAAVIERRAEFDDLRSCRE